MNIIFAALLILASCAPMKRIKPISTASNQNPCDEYQFLYQAQENELKGQIDQLQKEIALKNQVLAKFNLVDNEGRLRTTTKREDKIIGKEEWMK